MLPRDTRRTIATPGRYTSDNVDVSRLPRLTRPPQATAVDSQRYLGQGASGNFETRISFWVQS